MCLTTAQMQKILLSPGACFRFPIEVTVIADNHGRKSNRHIRDTNPDIKGTSKETFSLLPPPPPALLLPCAVLVGHKRVGFRYQIIFSLLTLGRMATTFPPPPHLVRPRVKTWF